VDLAENNYHYFLNEAEKEKFRLFYKGGLVYQLPWRKVQKGEAVQPVLANSSVIHGQTNANLRGKEKVRDGNQVWDMNKLVEDWAFFVMSMNRDIYMAPHVTVGVGGNAQRTLPAYHSSILAGLPVMCAGSIHIEDGVVKAIRNDSGHYQPTTLHMISMLQHFEMMGVSLKRLEIYDHEYHLRATGEEFLKANGDWPTIERRVARSTPQMREWEVLMKTQYKGGREGGTDFPTLVRGRYEELKQMYPQMARDQLWARAHREVAFALGEVDGRFYDMAMGQPIPFTPPPRPTTPHGPRPRGFKPQVPPKANRPKVNPRTGRPF
jgi:hypothetical protein